MKRFPLLYGMLLIALLPQIGKADNYIIINQVMYDSPLNEIPSISPCCNGEFVELYNAGIEDVSLEGWQLTGDGVSEKITFPQGTDIPAGGFLVIACRRGGSNTFQLADLYTLPDNTDYSILYQNKITLSNDGETLTLCNAQNDTIDWMEYDGESHLSKPYRLEAANADSTPGNLCVSLHRTWVEFDADGKVIPGTSQWKKDYVTFAVGYLQETSYSEISLIGEQAMQTGDNYVLSITPLDPTTRIDMSNGRPSMSSGIRVRTSLQYMDGLGRADELIALGVTPGKHDLVSVTDYHDKSHAARQWLPVAMNTEGQRMDIAAIQSLAQTGYGDNYPYSEAEYENSALRRQIKQILPGRSYRSHAAKQTYNLNDATDNVRLYTVGSDDALHTDGTYYANATLYKHILTDEESMTLITYTDKQGRKIMEKRGNNSTYYVYDELGRLRFVLPGLPDSKLSNGTYQLSDPYLKAAAYCYKYDGNGNMIYKRLPGCEAQYMVYDQLGQLVLKQDGNQRTDGKWTMCAYDSIGRNLYTAEILLEQTHEELIAFFADKWQVEHYGHNYSFPLAGTGYASRLLKNQNIRLLTINYYDNYDYLDILPTPIRQKLCFSEESGYVPKCDNTTGLLTGTRVYRLSEDGYTSNAYYYDIYGRIIQNRSVEDSIRYSAIGTEYLFDGSVAQQKMERHKADDVANEHYRYTYDHAGRLVRTYYQLNNDPEITLAQFSYDSIGRVAQKLLHNNRDIIRYSYDMRNMLTQTQNRHFSERLFYADSLPSGVGACHNGNIAAAYIANRDTACTFAFAYDAQNRLLSSMRQTDNGTSDSELFTYDEVGNVRSLKRFSNNRKIDDLHYDYGNEGNQLLAITDDGQDADDYSTIEYHNAETQADTTMRYDANGNLVYDADRGISAIRYNILNLPDTIRFVNGNQIVNLYNAAGQKYKSITYTVPATAVAPQYEIVHYTFETDTVMHIITEYAGNIEAIYTPLDTICRIHNSIGYYSDSTYYHYIKDHLGNVCAVINSVADTVVQSTLFYASGVPLSFSTGRDKQPYLYNGKEFVEAHGYNTYDYGFRGYYAPAGHFTTIDPLAEQTPWQSPYSYAGNNFINAIDWMGLYGMTGRSEYGWTAVNDQGVVIGVDLKSSDTGVYLVDDDWDETYDGLALYPLIGWQIPGIRYKKDGVYDFVLLGGGVFSSEFRSATTSWGYTYQFGFSKDNNSTTIGILGDAAEYSSAIIGIGANLKCNSVWWIGKNGQLYFNYQIHTRGGFARSYKLVQASIQPLKNLSSKLAIVGLGLETIEIMTDGEIKPSNAINILMGIIAPTGLGATIDGVYFIVDTSVLIVTGSTIGEKLDARYGSYSLNF